jgi:hypothetical protein
MLINRAMMAITTNSSISVNPLLSCIKALFAARSQKYRSQNQLIKHVYCLLKKTTARKAIRLLIPFFASPISLCKVRCSAGKKTQETADEDDFSNENESVFSPNHRLRILAGEGIFFNIIASKPNRGK